MTDFRMSTGELGWLPAGYVTIPSLSSRPTCPAVRDPLMKTSRILERRGAQEGTEGSRTEIFRVRHEVHASEPGPRFDHLGRAARIINADVLDAWYPPAPAVLESLQEHLPWLLRTSLRERLEGRSSGLAGGAGRQSGTGGDCESEQSDGTIAAGGSAPGNPCRSAGSDPGLGRRNVDGLLRPHPDRGKGRGGLGKCPGLQIDVEGLCLERSEGRLSGRRATSV